MNSIELLLPDGRSSGVHFCYKCRNVARSQALADQCCVNYRCSVCGADTGGRTWTMCEPCRQAADHAREHARYEKAKKLTTWDGPVYCEGFGNDGYAMSLDELLEDIDDNVLDRPAYCYATKPHRFAVLTTANLCDYIDMDRAYEDFETDSLQGVEELQAAFARFNEANKDVVSYTPDFNQVILLPSPMPVPE